jgi:hypothetical protein
MPSQAMQDALDDYNDAEAAAERRDATGATTDTGDVGGLDAPIGGEPQPLSAFMAGWGTITLGPEKSLVTYRVDEPTWGDQDRIELILNSMLPPVIAAAIIAPGFAGDDTTIDVPMVGEVVRANWRNDDGTPLNMTDFEVAQRLTFHSRSLSAAAREGLMSIILIGLSVAHPEITMEDIRRHLSLSRAVTACRRILGLGGNMASDFLPPVGDSEEASPE